MFMSVLVFDQFIDNHQIRFKIILPLSSLRDTAIFVNVLFGMWHSPELKALHKQSFHRVPKFFFSLTQVLSVSDTGHEEVCLKPHRSALSESGSFAQVANTFAFAAARHPPSLGRRHGGAPHLADGRLPQLGFGQSDLNSIFV